MAQNSNGSAGPLDRLKSEATGLLDAIGDRAVSTLRDSVDNATDRLTDYGKGGATPGLKAAAAGAKSLTEGKGSVSSLVSAGTTAAKEKISNMAGKGGGGKKQKVTNIVESIDVGVPVRVAYDQWTRFTDFPKFMKKVESVEQSNDQKLNWKAQILWSHRTWESKILEQKPDEKIIWRSKGSKGYVDGAVTFHELAPNLTKVLVVLEYHPQGFFEHTGNIWRAQGRRVRLELKHFRRYVMTEALLHADDIEGWRGTISDGKVKRNERGSSRSGGRKKARDNKTQDTKAQQARRGGSNGNGESRQKRSQSTRSTGTRSSSARSRQPASRTRS